MTDTEKAIYGANRFGQTEYGGSILRTESPTLTATTTPTASDSGSGTQQPSITTTSTLGGATTTTESFELATKLTGTIFSSPTTGGSVDSGTVENGSTVALSTDNTGSESSTLNKSTTVVSVPNSTQSTENGSFVDLTKTENTETTLANSTVVDIEIADAKILEAADAAQSETPTLDISVSGPSVLVASTTADAVSEQTTGQKFPHPDRTVATVSLPAVTQSSTVTASPFGRGVEATTPTLSPEFRAQSFGIGATNPITQTTAQTYTTTPHGRAFESGTATRQSPAPRLAPELTIASEKTTAYGDSVVTPLNVWTTADGRSIATHPPTYLGTTTTDAYSTASQLTGPTYTPGDDTTARENGSQTATRRITTNDVGFARPEPSITKPTRAVGSDYTFTDIVVDNISIPNDLTASSHGTAAETPTKPIELHTVVAGYGSDTATTSTITTATTVTTADAGIADDTPTVQRTTSVSTSVSTTATPFIPMESGISTRTVGVGHANDGGSHTKHVRSTIAPHISTTVTAIQQTQPSYAVAGNGRTFDTSTTTASGRFTAHLRARSVETLEHWVDTAPTIESAPTTSDESPTITAPHTVRLTSTLPVSENGIVETSVSNTLVGWAPTMEAGRTDATYTLNVSTTTKAFDVGATLLTTDINAIVKSDGSVFEVATTTYETSLGPITDTSNTADGAVALYETDQVLPENTGGSVPTQRVTATPTVSSTISAPIYTSLGMTTDSMVLGSEHTESVETPHLPVSIVPTSDSVALVHESSTQSYAQLFETELYGSLSESTRVRISDTVSLTDAGVVGAELGVSGTATIVETPTTTSATARHPTQLTGSTSGVSSTTCAVEMGSLEADGSLSITGRIPGLERSVSITATIRNVIGFSDSPTRHLSVRGNDGSAHITSTATIDVITDSQRRVVIRTDPNQQPR